MNDIVSVDLIQPSAKPRIRLYKTCTCKMFLNQNVKLVLLVALACNLHADMQALCGNINLHILSIYAS